MLRRAAFLLLTCWVVCNAGAAPAQSAAQDKCSYRAIAMAIRAGQTPDVSGCNPIIVFRNLQEAGFRPVPAAAADANVERGLVSHIAIQDRAATIYVSTGAPPPPPTPPAREQEAAPTPPPPVIANPAPAGVPPPVVADPAPAPGTPPAPQPAPAEPIVSAPPPPAPGIGPANPPLDTTPIVNPGDPALTNGVDGANPAVDDSEAATNAVGDGAGAQPPPRPTWFERLLDMAPWWPIAAILSFGAIAYAIRKWWVPPPPPTLYPTWDVDPGGASIAGKLPTIPGWPSFSARTAIEWGGASLPDPLPQAEEENG